MPSIRIVADAAHAVRGLAVDYLWWTHHKALGVTAAAGIVTLATDQPILHRTAVIVAIAVLAAADMASWAFARHLDQQPRYVPPVVLEELADGMRRAAADLVAEDGQALALLHDGRLLDPYVLVQYADVLDSLRRTTAV
nr:hypothetical protein [Streptomyces sp. TLI_235]